MRDVSSNLNVNEYSPEKMNGQSRSVSRGRMPTQSALSIVSPGERSVSPTTNSKMQKSILMTSGKKRDQYSPTKLDPRLQTIQDAVYSSLKENLDSFCTTLRRDS